MDLVVNGETRSFEHVVTLDDLIDALSLPGQRHGIAIAVNDTVVPRARWSSTRVQDGDRVEVIQAVSGG